MPCAFLAASPGSESKKIAAESRFCVYLVSVAKLVFHAKLILRHLNFDLDLDHLFRGMLLRTNKLSAIEIPLMRPGPGREVR